MNASIQARADLPRVPYRQAPLVLLLLAVAILAVQSVLSRLWLRSFRYGPLEWVWRSVTWWRPVTLRRAEAQPARPVTAGSEAS